MGLLFFVKKLVKLQETAAFFSNIEIGKDPWHAPEDPFDGGHVHHETPSPLAIMASSGSDGSLSAHSAVLDPITA
jgi:hypothetical protein